MTIDEKNKSKQLVEFQKKLYTLGESLNYPGALELIDEAVSGGMREVDILLGFLAPLLTPKSLACGPEEILDGKSLTYFSLKLIESLRLRRQAPGALDTCDVLLATQINNPHRVGVQLLELWLGAENISAQSISGSDETILEHFKKQRPKVFGLSLSEYSQVASARELILKIRSSCVIPPLFLVGGIAVKFELMTAADIPEAILISDTDKLFLTIKTHLSLGFLYDLKTKGS